MSTLTPIPLRLSLFLPIAGALAGCAANEAAGDFDVDTREEISGDVDTVDPNSCFFLGCEDGDMCTDDFCIENGARCIHVARNAFEACQVDAHCDDDNPCTVDRCALDDCNLMRCVREFVPDCRPCRSAMEPGAFPPGFNECDDGNPCTTETCGEDGMCRYSAQDPTCDPKCVWQQALPVDAVQYNYVYDGQTILGVAGANLGLYCPEGACACDANLGIKGDTGFGFPLHAVSSEIGPFICDVEVCDTPGATCTPLVAGASYVAWGHFVTSLAFAAPAPPPPQDAGAQADVALPPTVTALEVEGYCLSTRTDHLPGEYEGELVVGAQTARFGLTVSPNLVGTLHDCEGCAELGLTVSSTASLGSSDTAAVVATIQLTGAPFTATLRPWQSLLKGPIADGTGAAVGTLTLTRTR